MKSDLSVLQSRGFLPENSEMNFQHLTLEERLGLLTDANPVQRTLGARLLVNQKEAVSPLIEALRKEKKLYSKLEICHTLSTLGKDAVKPLIAEVGKIGKNHYTEVPFEPFKKKNYPLPHDIVARILIRMDSRITLPVLLENLNEEPKALIELIDAIGYICFYNPFPDSVFEKLQGCYKSNRNNDLIRWKLMRAFSAFPESKYFLQDKLKTEQHKGIKQEIERSLRILEIAK